jgi:hypothetical protein
MIINGNFFKRGAVIIVCGYTGQGKTPIIKKIISAARIKNKICFDPRREYDLKQWTVFYNFDIFRQSMTMAKQAAIIFEEATANISAFKDKDLADIYTASEHNLNVIFMVFHSLADVPINLIRNSHFLILFESIDTEESLQGLRKIFLPLLKTKKPVFINVRKFIGAEK